MIKQARECNQSGLAELLRQARLLTSSVLGMSGYAEHSQIVERVEGAAYSPVRTFAEMAMGR